MSKRYIIGLDEGTTSVRTVLFDTTTNQIVHIEKLKFTQHFPKSGWVEHSAEEIWNCLEQTLNTTIDKFKLNTDQIYGIGITNQRETVVAWNKQTGEPVNNAIVWQCRRTSEMCKKISNKSLIKQKTGLIVDAYFSATKMSWLITHNKTVRELIKQNNLCFGTIDSYILFKLTNGNSFYTDVTNASRTMLYNINTLSWDKKLLTQFNIPEQTLPKVLPNACEFGLAQTKIGEIPVLSMIGDQQASLFGQGCYSAGMAKNTYGTGCFILMNVGSTPVNKKSLLTTIAWQIGNKVTYALEGSVFNAGSALEWGNRLGLFNSSSETSKLAESVPNTDGVYMVPAFNGLGAPHWKPHAKGIIYGITGGTTKAHISRAILESMAFSTYDIIKSMEKQNIKLTELRVDGGVSKNDFLLKFQADLINTKLLRQQSIEATVLGAIYMAGLTAKVFKSVKDIENIIKFESEFHPSKKEYEVKKLVADWHNVVKKC